MSQKRQWDESRSPQWKYLLQKESRKKRKERTIHEKGKATTTEDEQLLYPLYQKRALTKAERRERKIKQLKQEYHENSK